MIINSVIKGSGGGGGTIQKNYGVQGACSIDNNFIASNFSSTNYILTNTQFPGGQTNWEFGTKIHTKSSVFGTAYIASSTDGSIFALGMYSGGNGSNFGDGSRWYSSSYSLVVVDSTFAADTTYWYKVTYNGARYSVQRSTDGVNFTEVVYMDCDQTIPATYLGLGGGGGGYLVDTMDLKETYFKVDNVELWRAVVIP